MKMKMKMQQARAAGRLVSSWCDFRLGRPACALAKPAERDEIKFAGHCRGCAGRPFGAFVWPSARAREECRLGAG